MSEESRLREEMCTLAASLHSRGLTHGATGNVSARTSDGGLLVTPTGSTLGTLDPARLSRFDASGRHVDGDKPTKEMPLHEAFYETRSRAGAIVHLHSTHSVAWSLLPDVDPRAGRKALCRHAGQSRPRRGGQGSARRRSGH